MFFFLSKTLSYLVMPLTIMAALLLLSGITKSGLWRKRLLWSAIIIFLLFTNGFIANELMKRWEVAARPYNSLHHYKLAIVLTGTIIPELKPADRVYFSKGADRIVHTVQLYKLGLVDRILVSGGSARIIDIQEREADRFREVMMLMGVPDSVIMVENVTRNTHESAIEVKNILERSGYTAADCLLITSAFHMRRSLACYQKVGLPLDTFSTDFYAHQSMYYPNDFLIPKLDALIIWHKLVHEWVGLTSYWLAGYI